MASNYVLVAGDLSITKSNEDAFASGNISDLFDLQLKQLIDRSDLFIINHEMALTTSDAGIKKRGGHLKANPSCAKGLKDLGVDLCCTANNHIVDYGTHGLESTYAALDEVEIQHVGSATRLSEIQNSIQYRVGSLNVCVYNVADNEFNLAKEDSGGVNVYDPLESFDHIRQLKQKNDYVLVIFHAGVERYRYPSPYLTRICRKMVECGANAVLCQHSHCIGAAEQYNGAYILYGQGNFLFDDGDNEFYNTGLLIKIDPAKNLVEPVPVVRNGNGVILANPFQSEQILSEFNKRCYEIQQEGKRELLFRSFVSEQRNVYLSALLCNNFWMRVLNKITKGNFYNKLFSNMNLYRLLNILTAEAHKECVLEILEVLKRGNQ